MVRITDIETAWVKVKCQPPQGLANWTITHSTDALCRITTDKGLQGIGEARGGIENICKVINYNLRPLLEGENPLYIQDLWTKMYNATLGDNGNYYSKAKKRDVKAAIAAVDLALWDIKSKYAKLSVCELLGGRPAPVPAYLAKGNYVEGRTAEEMAAELFKKLQEGNYNYVKIRIGRKGAKEAEERAKAVREKLGTKIKIMVDVNQGWDIEEAIQGTKAIEPYGIYWLEEPLKPPINNDEINYKKWDNQLAKLKEKISIPIATGENHTDLQEIKGLIDTASPKYIQYDAVKNGGVTEFLKVAALCEANGLYLAPHHVPHFHSQLAAAVPQVHIVECYDNKYQHPAWPDMFIGFPQIKNGKIQLSSKPGWGMEINDDFIYQYGELINWK